MSRIDAVLLDALGTLVTLSPPAPRLRASLERRGGVDVGTEASERAFGAEIAYYLDHHMDGSDRAALDDLRDRCAAVMHEALGVEGFDRAVVRAAMLDALEFTAFDDVVPTLEELRGRGLRLVVVSNWDCSLEYWLERAGVAQLVDGTVSSAVIGEPKPSPRVFETALELAGADADHALHVGDSPVGDIEGARAAGIRAVLVTRGAPAPEGVEAIESLAELPSLI